MCVSRPSKLTHIQTDDSSRIRFARTTKFHDIRFAWQNVEYIVRHRRICILALCKCVRLRLWNHMTLHCYWHLQRRSSSVRCAHTQSMCHTILNCEDATLDTLICLQMPELSDFDLELKLRKYFYLINICAAKWCSPQVSCLLFRIEVGYLLRHLEHNFSIECPKKLCACAYLSQ